MAKNIIYLLLPMYYGTLDVQHMAHYAFHAKLIFLSHENQEYKFYFDA